MYPVLQLALDVINEKRALQIASESVKGGVDWIEVGTPLIKSEGMKIIRTLKKAHPKKNIIADMKTMDTGALEVEMAAKAGADVVCILAAADDTTITDAVKAKQKYNVKILADLIGIQEIVSRAKRLEELGVDIICIHIGIDEQMKAKNPLDFVKQLSSTVNLPIAVAGGINSETAGLIVKSGASIVIVGGAITKSKKVTESTKTIKEAMKKQQAISSRLFKKYSSEKIVEAFCMVSTPNISDAMHRKGAMKNIHSINPGLQMVGTAVTVKTMDGDWAKPVEAIDCADPGQVLVIDAASGSTAVWGELASWSAKIKNLAGIVIDGAVRDIDEIKKIGLPVFCRNQVSCAGEPKGFGEIGPTIICGDQQVSCGDWIIGDDSGVVVVPKKDAQEIANRALDVKEHENRLREEIQRGGSLGEILVLEKWECVK